MMIGPITKYRTAPVWMQRTVAPYLLALLTAACGSAYEPRKDEIECALPDGSSFILRSTYLGLKPVHRHPTNIWVGGARSVNRSGFETYYRPAKDGRDLHAAGGHSWGLILSKYNDLNYMTRLCALHGMINGVPYVLANRYMPPEADRFERINSQHNLFRALNFAHEVDQSLFKDIEDSGLRFDRKGASWSVDTIIWRPDLLAAETPLVAKTAPDPAPVVGAYRIESHDGGQTWGNPHLTFEPEVFELGKPAAEQCFVARLVRIDIKGTVRNFEASFPDCPVAFALPERKQ
ncbi:hypothetical protein IAI53_02155 [Thauera sp. CAU 1555]|uniref:Uncharacterized protein n=1 Tax=Thauera sedimentorum TaxID=2767595 RepID=A0ABR9B5P9_9RHOO|nr:hypothetical protein [Thauera sedimentorum]MBC9070756.1 hypothetical protein [Thauera sedimentorum]MBD8501675.1 hypothetical protein [Thauera sedimentorum]